MGIGYGHEEGLHQYRQQQSAEFYACTVKECDDRGRVGCDGGREGEGVVVNRTSG